MQTVRILNPAGGEGFTTIKRAQAYVDQGRAAWRIRPTGRLAIRFVEDHPIESKTSATKPSQSDGTVDGRRANRLWKSETSLRLDELPANFRPEIQRLTWRQRPHNSKTGQGGGSQHLAFPLSV
jgi:hypothetical protein